jgi:hypothetical protein
MLRVLSILALLLASAAPSAAKDCGRLPRGKNPTMPELSAEIARVSARHNVPTEIIKAVAHRESGCQQWRADGTLVYNKTDCGLGMMQLTGATAKQFDVERLKDEWKYNLDCGVRVLVQKWKRAERKGQAPTEPEARRVLENWYYAVAYYWGGKTESYLKKIFDHLEKRPGRLKQLLAKPVRVTLASEAIPGFKFGDVFRAWPKNRFTDAKGKNHTAPTHVGTIGDPRTIAMLETLLARGKKALDQGKPKRAFKHLFKVIAADLDTQHKLTAEKLLEPFLTKAQAEFKAAKLVGRTDALKAFKALAKTWKGHPLGDKSQAAYEALKKRR